MNQNLRISKAGLDHIKSFEGRFLKAYYCPAGVLTIGYGHTNLDGSAPKVVPGMTITAKEADEILVRTLATVYEAAIKRLVKVPLTQSQYDALAGFTFNLGESNLKKSTLLRKLNAGNYDAVPAELMKWTRANGKELAGLVRRRRAEAAMWRSMASAETLFTTLETAPLPQQIDEPKPLEPTTVDKMIEKASVAAPLITTMSSFYDWKVAAVVAGAAVAIIVTLIVVNRSRD